MTSVGAVICSQSRARVVRTGDRVLACDRRADRAGCSDAGRCPRRSATRAGGRSSRRRDTAPSPTGPPRRGGRRAGGRTGGSAVPVRRTARRRPWMSRGRASERAPDARIAISWAIAPPKERPTMCAWSTPAASSRPRRLRPSSRRRRARSRESAPRAAATDRSATAAVRPMPVRNRTGGRARRRGCAAAHGVSRLSEIELTSPQFCASLRAANLQAHSGGRTIVPTQSKSDPITDSVQEADRARLRAPREGGRPEQEGERGVPVVLRARPSSPWPISTRRPPARPTSNGS